MLNKLQRILFSTLLSLACIAAHANADWQHPDYLFKAFKEVALKNEYAPTLGRVHKWQRPVRFKFKYHSLARNILIEDLFIEQFKHLSSITQHPIKRTTAKPNLTIHLTRDESYGKVIAKATGSMVENLNRDSNCMGTFQTDSRGAIIGGQIVLPVDHLFSRGLLVSCIIEETTQVMGLPNDSDWVHPSIANDKSDIVFLTGLDYLFLKILYAAEIEAGMHGHKLDILIKKTIEQLKQNHEIRQAPKTVNQQGLYPLVN